MLIKWFGLVQPINGSYYSQSIYILGAIICGIIPFIVILFQVLKYLITKGREDIVLMAMVAFLSSYLFVFAGTFFAHVLAASFMLLAYIQYQKSNFLICGMLSGLGFLTEYTTLWIIFSWIIIELIKHKSFKSTFQLMLGFLPAILFIFCYNYYFTGHPFKMLYLFVADNFDTATKSTYGLGMPKLKAVFGLLFSENRGLLFYAPVLVYGLFLFFTSGTSKVKNYMFHPVFLPFILTTLFLSSHAAWEGGWSYGPRHLASVTTLLIFGLVQSQWFGTNSSIFWIVCGYGLSCTLLAKLTVIYSVPELSENILSYLLSKLKDAFNDGNVLSLIGHQKPIIAFYMFLIFLLGMFYFRPRISKSIEQ
jgi:hypothetical protein